MRLESDFIRDASGYPYRVSKIDRIVNNFTESGSAANSYNPPGGERVVITNLLVSTDTACTVTLSGSSSDPMVFYFGNRGGVSMQLNEHAPIVGEIDENFVVLCEFSGGATGNCTSVIFGYRERKGNSYS